MQQKKPLLTISQKIILILLVIGMIFGVMMVTGVFGDTRIGITMRTNPDLENGLVGHWSFDALNFDISSTTGTILDTSGYDNRGYYMAAGESSYIRGSYTGTSSTTLDIGTAGTDRLVVVLFHNEGLADLSSVTVDDNSCNFVDMDETSPSIHVEMWYCDEDDLGVSAGSVVIDSVGGDAGWVTDAYLFTGITQNGPYDFGTSTSNVGTKVTVTDIDAPLSGLIIMGAANTTTNNSADYDIYTTPMLAKHIDGTSPAGATSGSGLGFANASTSNLSYFAQTEGSTPTAVAVLATWEVTSVGDNNAEKGTGGVIGQGLNFDGIDDFVMIDSDTELEDTPLSLAMWVRIDSDADGETLAMKGAFNNTVGNGWWRLYIQTASSNTLRFSTDRSGGDPLRDSTTAAYVEGDWFHVVVTYDNGDSSSGMNFYINGELNNGSGSGSGTDLSDAGQAITLGAYAYAASNFIDGAMDDVRFYNRVISAEEAKRLYQLGATTKVNKTITTNPDLKNGLVGHWTFDGNDLINNATDSSGSGNTGFLNGFSSTTTKPGRVGQSLDFDGTNDYVNAGSAASLDNITDYTMCAWINPESFGGSDFGRIFSKGGLIGGDGFEFILDVNSGGRVLMYHGGTMGPSLSNTIKLNTWQHVCASNDDSGPTLSIYYNGEFNNGGAFAVLPAHSAFSLYIGESAETSNRKFDGRIDDVRIYNRTLSAQEIRKLYDLGATTKINKTITTNPNLENGLIGHWTFDGPFMDTASNTAEVLDRSANQNHGDWQDHGTTTKPGVIGQAIYFEDTTNDVYVGDPVDGSLDIGTSDFAVCFWFQGGLETTSVGIVTKQNSTKNGWRIHSDMAGGVNGMSLDLNDDGGTNTNNGISSPVTDILREKRWYHTCANADRDVSWEWFLDNVSQGTNSLAGEDEGSLNTDSSFCMGTHIGSTNCGDSPYYGGLDDVRFYNRLLTRDEITRIYNLGN